VTAKNISGAPVKLYMGQDEVPVFDRFTNPDRFDSDPRTEMEERPPIMLGGHESFEFEDHQLAIHALHQFCNEARPPGSWRKWAHDRDCLREESYYVIIGNKRYEAPKPKAARKKRDVKGDSLRAT
jgi:hypothetical protein